MRGVERIPSTAIRMLVTTIVALLVCMSFLLPSIGLASDYTEDSKGWVEGDFVVSYDEEEITGAKHPSVAVSPSVSPFPDCIHAVWDEVDETTGLKEIHYSMTTPDFPGYPYEWSNDSASEGDRIISQTRKGKATFCDAVDPSIAVDSSGVIHVVWAEAYDDGGNITWEIHYAFSDSNGKFWSSEDGQVPGHDIRISKYTGERLDAEAIPGGPKITVSLNGNGKAPEALNVVWAEYDSKNGQEIFHSHSRDGGVTWSGSGTDKIISSTGTFEYAFEPCVAPTGEFGEFIHVAWKQEFTGKAPTDEIYHTRSENYGDEWSGQELLISNPGIPATIESVDIAGGAQDLHIVWTQVENTKAPATGVFYAGSMNDGNDFFVKEHMISDASDGYPAYGVSIGASRTVTKANPVVHAAWSEFDNNSPTGTMEVHTSMTYEPQDPDSWTGQKEDIVISWPDEVPGANVNNVSLAMGNIGGEWLPQIVWDEMNLTQGKNGRGQPNTEIHFDPPPIEFTLTTSVVGSGTIIRNPDQSTYPDGTPVQLTASPNSGWTFDHWSGDLSGSTNPDTIIMDSDKTVTAHFVNKDLVAASVSGPSGCTEGDTIGILRSFNNAGSAPSGTFLYGLYLSTNSVISRSDTLIYSYQYPSLAPSASSTGTVNVGLPMGLTGTYWYGLIVDVNYEVTESDEGNNIAVSPSTVTINPAQFTLTVNIVGSGTVTKNPDQPTYTYNQVVQLTANADPGWTFSHWSGDLTGSTNPDTITMTGDMFVTATFTLDQYTLTVSTSGSGSVNKNPNQATYTYGTPVTLTANPNVGWYFDYWSGDLTGSANPDVITIYGNSAVTAHFAQEQYTLTTSVVGSGSVTKNPNQATYTYGQVVQLTAVADTGWSFDHWSGDLTGSTNPETVTITGDMFVTATFTPNQYTLTVSTSGSGSVNKNPDQATYTYGQVVTLTANPTAGWSFDHWSGDLTGSTNPDTITIIGNMSVTAHFTQDQYTLTIWTIGSGSVDKNPDQATYTYGQDVILTANPAAGWEFDHWTGGLTGSNNPDTVTITGDTTIWAFFNEITFNRVLTQGWNLVSFPLVQADTSINTVLSSISGNWDIVQYYDAADTGDHWKTYSTFKPASLNDLTDLDHTMAFWLHIKVPSCTMTLYGADPISTSIPLYTGWNLVGYPTRDTTTTISTALTGTGYDAVEGYDSGGPYLLKALADSYIMQPGEGYWVHVPADTTWTINW